MNFSNDFHYFKIDDRFYGGEQPPYQPEFDTESSFQNPEVQTQFKNYQELLKNFEVFIDLREMDEPYYEYAYSLPDSVSCERLPIRDISVPESPEEMQKIIDRIQLNLDAGYQLYLHCHGGRGRTGTVAGCWLAYRYHLTGMEAVLKLNDLFADSCLGRLKRACPETPEQMHFILDYAAWIGQKRSQAEKRGKTIRLYRKNDFGKDGSNGRSRSKKRY